MECYFALKASLQSLWRLSFCFPNLHTQTKQNIMTKKQWQNRLAMFERLESIGFTRPECESLRRIEMTLHRWSEHECNGNIQREGDDGEGKPRWFSNYAIENQSNPKGYRIPDRERGALKRLGKIISDCNTRNCVGFSGPIQDCPKYIVSYHQTDPRGCALYVGLKSELGDRSINSCYSRLISVCD